MSRNQNRVHVISPRKGRRYYSLRWICPVTGTRREVSTKTKSKREAYVLAAEKEQELNAGRVVGNWVEVTIEYEQHCRLGPRGLEGWTATRRRFDAFLERIGVDDPNQITARVLDRYVQSELQDLAPATQKTHVARLRACLRWAERAGYLDRAPTVPTIRVGAKLAKGRALSEDEYAAFLRAIPLVRPHDAAKWEALAQGLWHSGFRLSELLKLSWEPAADWCLSTTAASLPIVLIRNQKNGREQQQAITPSFYELCRSSDSDPMFRVGVTPRTASRVLSEVGRRSQVLVDERTRKFASAHDLRRSFAARIGGELTLAQLSQWMRHRDPSTTLSYYAVESAENLATNLWHRVDNRSEPG